ncbi:MAG: hypothetical protein BWX88_04336 [Planctomycetes bacterium ADurb.Bin126]|nr:MAG: hypothetical protein BWX88_04336 [Planctomycetes bacterium ADurb.Bin126]
MPMSREHVPASLYASEETHGIDNSWSFVELVRPARSPDVVLGRLADCGIEAKVLNSPAVPVCLSSPKTPAIVGVRKGDLDAARKVVAAMESSGSVSYRLTDLRVHADRLMYVLAQVCDDMPSVICEEERFTAHAAVEHLELAAGLKHVDIDTAPFDDCIMLCSTSYSYEEARSDVAARVATELVAFTFTWGAFETLAKVIQPPAVPKSMNPNGTCSLVDRAMWMLRRATPVFAYSEILSMAARLLPRGVVTDRTVRRVQKYLPYMSYAGLGLDMVRCCRNEFAHGAFVMPAPEEWSGERVVMPQFIRLSLRLALFSIQMLLEVQFRDSGIQVSPSRDGGWEERTDVGRALTHLHLNDYRYDRLAAR